MLSVLKRESREIVRARTTRVGFLLFFSFLFRRGLRDIDRFRHELIERLGRREGGEIKKGRDAS